MINFLISINKKKENKSLSDLFIHKPQFKLCHTFSELEFIAWGDPIYNEDFNDELVKNANANFIISNLYGHYYYAMLIKSSQTLLLGNSLFSILPVYYEESEYILNISNDPFSIHCNDGRALKYNKRFLLENILFNYPLFNQSCIEGVNLLPSNHYMQLKRSKTTIRKHTNINDFFSHSPISWQKAADKISDLFIDTSKKYFPDKSYGSSLTAGFDGRTLTACGFYYRKNFFTYSFGSKDSADLRIAHRLSDVAGLEFDSIQLDGTYVKEQSMNMGLDFIRNCSGIASFARAHYLYAAKKISERTKCLVTGNFGSEVLRAAHNCGIVVSPNLYLLFKTTRYDKAISNLEDAIEWEWIDKSSFKTEWESLKEELKNLPCFVQEYKGLTKNQQFYIIVFEEILRKYFGAEMANQYQYVANRTPFLDMIFLKGILGTELAGVYSDFFTNNPFKRFKGQILYAHIIEKTYPAFGNEMTDKGYRPADLLSFKGKVKITGSFINKRILRRLNSVSDPFAVFSAFSVNKAFWEKLNVSPELFNVLKLKESVYKDKNSDSLFIALSQAWFYNQKFV